MAISAMFCKQVLKMPLELLPRTERKEILDKLGIDTKEVTNEVYREELVLNRVQQFCSVYNKLEQKRKEVGKEVGLQDVKQATLRATT